MKADRILNAASMVLCALIVTVSIFASAASNRRGIDGAYDARAQSAANTEERNVFSDFRRERTSVRNLELMQLNAICQDPDADEELRKRACAEILELTENMEAEATIEAVLMARGHAEAVATVHAGSVNVVIENGEDNKAESAFILDLVMRETGQTAGNVKIMTVGES